MSKEIKYIKYFSIVFVAVFTVLMLISLLWNIYKENQSAIEFAKIESIASFNKDLLYRRWATIHGGVYVPISETTPPNPYLAFLSERDITTNSGKKLTLVNPAYMTRQVYAIAEDQYGVKGHITSLKPIRPENKADGWETNALKLFEKGALEYYSIEQIDKKEYMRYMHAMKVEKNCLKCHASQGYKEGEIRGGISVSVPMEKYNQVVNAQIKDLTITHILIYLIILFFGSIGYKKILNEIMMRDSIQKKVIENEASLQQQNLEYASLNEEYKSQNEDLHLAKLKAEESDLLKTSFLQNMSHEIRTPMNAIIGFAGLLNKEELSEDKRKSFTAIIINNTNQLLSIVTDILTISAVETRQEKVKIQEVCINNLLIDLLSIFKTQANYQNISIYAKRPLSDKQSEIYTDNSKVTQILTNLLTNALKFTHIGFIEFGYTLVEEADGRAPLQSIQFYVKDTGIGIDISQQDKIFERFRQADLSITKKYGGTGLGLSISKGFVELLDGKIWVQSELKKGSTFYFTIPYKPVHEENISISPTIQYQNAKTVLIAEDHEFNYLFIEEVLEELNIKIIHAKNGEEAIEFCKSIPAIDLILMDIKMPVMDGFMAAKLIKEFRPELPIIAQSAYALENEIERYNSPVFVEYITKPINEEELKQKIWKYLNRN